LRRWLYRDAKIPREAERIELPEMLPQVRAVHTMYSMRHELAALWGRSMATRDQLVRQLQDWCQRAEASGIDELQRFSRKLRGYASLSDRPPAIPMIGGRCSG
jgi:stearoyl-CoA desaturase (delta-9 desaturase)